MLYLLDFTTNATFVPVFYCNHVDRNINVALVKVSKWFNMSAKECTLVENVKDLLIDCIFFVKKYVCL